MVTKSIPIFIEPVVNLAITDADRTNATFHTRLSLFSTERVVALVVLVLCR